PAPYAAQSFDAPGDWSWDPISLMIISTARRNRVDATRNLEYTVESVVSDPQGAEFVSASAGSPVDRALTTFLPAELPESIVEITNQVTAKESTAVLKAAAIQAYLNDPTRFTYKQTAPSGDGFEVLVNFLTKERQGYCIHFAAAMAVMARVEGIPSRVSVGFLPGTKVGDHWEVRAHNMHAWPELYFDGYGWVRFEPTSAVAAPPPWSVRTDVPGASASPTPTPTPSSSSPRPSTSVNPQGPDLEIDPGTTDGSTVPWGRILLGLSLALGALLLVSAPMLLREWIRRRRLGLSDDPHLAISNAWAEVRDSVHDLGRAWPRGTPREVAASVASGLEDDGADAMRRLGDWVERSRYARTLPETPTTLADEVVVARRELLVDQPWHAALLARFAPRSLVFNARDAVRGFWSQATEGLRTRQRLSAESSDLVTPAGDKDATGP
ncbi:MAG TPA: transglutaminase-like domain-containing protein, partial [Propionibacteriaceae bacterium]|nr:transglutaminase-like domain-containing protein [Propionibacteriaceae bacterium]